MGPVARLRCVYLLTYLSMGIFAPYMSLYLARRGLAPEDLPAVMAVVPLMRVVAPPVWGVLADLAGSRARILRLLAFCCLGASLLVPWAGDRTTCVLAFALLSATHGPIFAILDALALAATAAEGVEYGTVRNLGSLGFLLGVLLGGQLWAGDGILLAHRGLTGALALLVLASFLVPEVGGSPSAAPLTWSEARATLSQRPLLAVLGVAWLHTVVHTGYDMYFSIHCEAIGLSTRTTSLAWAAGVMAEVLALSRSGSLLGALGPVTLIRLGIGVAALRWACISALAAPALLVPLQVLHALTFGCWFLGSITLVDRLAPPELRASAQGVFAAVIGLANATGSMVWGPLVAHPGTRAAFQAMGFAELAVLLVALALLDRGTEPPAAAPA